VTIIPDGDTLGCVHFGRWARSLVRKRERIEEAGFIDFGSLVTSSAGAVAEKEAMGRFDNYGAREDCNANDVLLNERSLFSNWAAYQPNKPPHTTARLWAAAQGEAHAIVSLFWPAIEAIAKALLERKLLTYAEAKQIHFDALAPPKSELVRGVQHGS
jgi:hypothetical protein